MGSISKNSFTEGIDVELSMLLASVDAREHCIPTENEINKALREVKFFRIEKSDGGLLIMNDKAASEAEVTIDDINLAMKKYQNIVDDLLKS